MQSPILKGIR